MPATFSSPDKLDDHLSGGEEHDVFVYRSAGREVVLENDCRSYPLRLRATFQNNAQAALDAFADRCRAVYGIAFRASLPGALQTRIPGVAVKIGLYAPLDTLEVHFYKDAPRADRRRVMGWVVV